MKLRAYAKLNLTLDITGVRSDGYHEMDMLMQSVSLFDTVTVNPSENCLVTLYADDTVPAEKNTLTSAAHLFLDAAKIKRGVTVTLEKRIPSCAGMAGGSADAAAVLTALMNLYPGALTKQELDKIALCVGADVPFCMRGGLCRVRGIGDNVEPLNPPLSDCVFAVAKPDCGVSTPLAFKKYDSADSIVHPDTALAIKALSSGDSHLLCKSAANVLEAALPGTPAYNPVTTAKKIFSDNGCIYSLMTGSGSAVFAMFSDKKQAVNALYALEKTGELVQTFVLHPVQFGTEIIKE